ncbi:tetratricopeptide repeat protein [Erwinia sorbitola]|uniref:Sel1 repeat family protein n=1 Tax=Erwinia sorbitola TaxID=2681984 RepID=A0A6I6ELY2_9GAMM|nr:tetratricopeptide repeat protein [Erwinia sorbitola]MTD27609.1 hypothetical protein [Erwinia sorbitola]QGU89145.1 hypothetical protein GN242_18785 [Erwinia sorbitola]
MMGIEKVSVTMRTFLYGIIIIMVSSIISTAGALYLSDKSTLLFEHFTQPTADNQHEKSLQLLKRSAITGNMHAQFKLGTIYYLGHNVAKDDVESRFWFNVAYNSGSMDAEVNLASMYKYGEGGEKDLKKSIELYSDAARKGSSVALYNLGKMYLSGDSLEKNERYGVSLLQDSCKAGFEKSCHLLQQIFSH